MHWEIDPATVEADKAEFVGLPSALKEGIVSYVVDFETVGLDFGRTTGWAHMAHVAYADGTKRVIPLPHVTDHDMRSFNQMLHKALTNARGGHARNGRKKRSLRRRLATGTAAPA